jgi:transposase
MAHARRHFFELYKALKSPLAKEGVDRIDVLYDIEEAIRGRSPPERRAARQDYAVPLLNEMHAWMIESLTQIDAKSDLAEALNYSLNRYAERQTMPSLASAA